MIAILRHEVEELRGREIEVHRAALEAQEREAHLQQRESVISMFHNIAVNVY